MNPTQQQIEEWKAQHKDVFKLTPVLSEEEAQDFPEIADAGFIARKPTRADLSRLATTVTSDSVKAMHNLVLGCMLFPGADTMTEILAKYPGLIVNLADLLQNQTGASIHFLPSKL